MQGEFDDILGPDYKMEDDIIYDAPDDNNERLNDAYEKAQKRWGMEMEVKEELKKQFEQAQRELMEQKKMFDNDIVHHKEKFEE